MPFLHANLCAPRVVSSFRLTTIALSLGAAATTGVAQKPRALMPIDFQRSAEFRWLNKSVQASRVLDDMTQAATWRMTGTGTLNDGWQHVVWEIEPLARDRVTSIEIGYWVNKMLAAPTDRVAFEIGRLELQRVDPDHHTGWNVAPGRIAFSHSGYQVGQSKTAIASDLAAPAFDLVRVNDNALGQVVMRAPVSSISTRLGAYQQLDFSAVNVPGTYVLRAGGVTTQPFRIGTAVWKESIWKTLNFFYGERCGVEVPGSHGVDHLDWFATHGEGRISMAGGWHDAGDLSQGVINTGEATYAMFALAERVRAQGDDSARVMRLIEEAKWGLDWVLRVRFPGGYRMGFASHNLWTNNVVGDADDRTREAKNNPNANYIAAAAEAIAYRVLKEREPELAERSLRTAEEDWSYAIVGVEGPSTWHTPAFAATRVELAGIGITASVELYRGTKQQKYLDKAVELARTIVASQQQRRVGRDFPLAGFFYTGPDRDTLFHQFHRGNDQAAIVALAQLVDALPDHSDWMSWYATIVRCAEYHSESVVRRRAASWRQRRVGSGSATGGVDRWSESVCSEHDVREGYDWSQQYSVSSGDFVGSLPVGMQSRGVTDVPYWPQQNTYVYKEVWVHPSARWLWLMEDLLGPAPVPRESGFAVSGVTSPNGIVTIRLTGTASGVRTVTLEGGR